MADAEGPDAISMRRIARELSAGAMSLYWYVGSKEELLELMLDAIEAEIEVPEPSGDWRADLGTFAHRTRAALSRHRWAVEFIGTRPPSGPNDVRNLERLLGLLDGTGIDDFRLIMGIFMTVATFVIGAVIREAQEIRFHREQERAEAALTEEEIQAERDRYHEVVRGLRSIPADRPPHGVRHRPGRPGHPGRALPVQPGLRARRHRRPPRLPDSMSVTTYPKDGLLSVTTMGIGLWLVGLCWCCGDGRHEGPAALAFCTASVTPWVHGSPWPGSSRSASIPRSASSEASA